MAWQRNYVVLKTGERVRYAFVQRPGEDVYFVRFRSQDGRRLERSTGARKKPDAVEAAHRIILEEHLQVAPTAESVPWEVARAKLAAAMAADGKRPKTIDGYLETLTKLAAMFPRALGPADVTERVAVEFKTRYASVPFFRKRKVRKGELTPSYPRKAKSLDTRLRTLKAAFGWFKYLRLVETNPFAEISLPQLDRHEVKYVRPTDIREFFDWLGKRFPEWAMPRLFFTVKALTACRLDDLCRLRAKQLRDGRLVFSADVTKNRSERYASLPADVYGALDAYKGKTYLWERYPVELIAVNRTKGFPVHRQNPVFDPRRLYLWVVQLMQVYQKETGRDLSSHDFRRAAFTRAAEKDIHPKRAAVAFDVTTETMLKYYTATEKKRTADEVLTDLADDLVPT
jgi:integrase